MTEEFMNLARDILLDTIIDSAKLIPFLLLTYLLMEWIEKKGAAAMKRSIANVNQAGPLIGSILGVVPQCGFSTAAANLYSGRVITLGTMIAVFFSTSDEMLPILIGELTHTDGVNNIDVISIVKILVVKVIISIASGYLVQFVLHLTKKRSEAVRFHEVCEEEHCHCERGVFLSALRHTGIVLGYIFAISLALNILIEVVDPERLKLLFTSVPVLGQFVASLFGLIPNCATSVVLTELYVSGVITPGIMMSGLLVNAGIGLVVLFRLNKKPTQNLLIVISMVLMGTMWGSLIDLICSITGFTF